MRDRFSQLHVVRGPCADVGRGHHAGRANGALLEAMKRAMGSPTRGGATMRPLLLEPSVELPVGPWNPQLRAESGAGPPCEHCRWGQWSNADACKEGECHRDQNASEHHCFERALEAISFLLSAVFILPRPPRTLVTSSLGRVARSLGCAAWTPGLEPIR